MRCFTIFRRTVLMMVWPALVATAQAAPTEPVPYQARVVVARAQVRSGPGENYYPTDVLAAGELVEVYREEQGGWLAIRPPRESFSWVFGRHVKLLEGGLAEIDKANVDSRIGSRFSGKRNAVQVRLRKGEIVEVLGEETEGAEKWYKIAPPAGEFRWIRANHVERVGPVTVDSADSTTETVVVTSASDGGSGEKQTAENETGADQPVSSQTTTESEVPAPAGADAWRAAPAAGQTVPTAAGMATSAPGPIANQPGKAVGPVGDELERALTEIELRLSRMVAAPPQEWNTERLERDCTSLLGQAKTGAEQEAVKATLAKIERFAAIGRRYRQGVGSLPSAGASQPPITPIEDGLAVALASSQPPPINGTGHDAVGILRPVVSRRPGAPQFALVDDRGQVVAFVTPTPDMNLQPYVGRRIGVSGARGYIAEFQRAHVTAGRVTPLNDRLMR